MAMKDNFLSEIKIGDIIDIVSDSQEISGLVKSFDSEMVCIRLETGAEQTVRLDSISYYEIDKKTAQDSISKTEKYAEVKEPLESEDNRKYKTPIENVGFSLHTFNALRRSGNYYLEDLAGKNAGYFLKIRNIGKKNLAEIIKKCEEQGITTGSGFENL